MNEKVNAFLREYELSTWQYERAMARLSELHLNLPARRRATFGYALALRDCGEETSLYRRRARRAFRRGFWAGVAVILIAEVLLVVSLYATDAPTTTTPPISLKA